MLQADISPKLRRLVEQYGEALFSSPDNKPLPHVREGRVELIAHPSTTDELAKIVASADGLGLKLAARGQGSKIERGNAALRIDLIVDMSAFDRIVAHAAGDLTVTVQAGVSLYRLQTELARAGQFLALDPPFAGSIGGLIASGDSGPRRLRYGGVRDQILGVTFVRADGVIAHGGGKVVKNVAGYDLPKLFTGSLGTLGIITEAVFRLYSLPATSATVMITDVAPPEAAAFAARVLDSTLVPTSLDYVQLDGATMLAVRFEAPASSTVVQAERARSLFGRGEILRDAAEAQLWAHFDSVAQAPTLAHLIAVPADLGRLLGTAERQSKAAGATLSVRAHIGHGHALLGWDNPRRETAYAILAARRAAALAGGNLVLWRAPAEIRAAIETWGEVGDSLGVMRRIKSEFDLNNTLNPGRFVGGI